MVEPVRGPNGPQPNNLTQKGANLSPSHFVPVGISSMPLRNIKDLELREKLMSAIIAMVKEAEKNKKIKGI
jgi:hypothetical protein